MTGVRLTEEELDALEQRYPTNGGICSQCQREVLVGDPEHRITPILEGGRGVECALRGDYVPAGRRPVPTVEKVPARLIHNEATCQLELQAEDGTVLDWCADEVPEEGRRLWYWSLLVKYAGFPA